MEEITWVGDLLKVINIECNLNDFCYITSPREYATTCRYFNFVNDKCERPQSISFLKEIASDLSKNIMISTT